MATTRNSMSECWRVGILTVSDTRAQGLRADTATPLIRRRLEEAGFVVSETALVPDEPQRIQERLADMADRLKVPLILTTGGTGFGARDVTPEATKAVIDREVPGLPEAMRAATAKENPLAWLSRGVAGLRGRTLIVNLPGSPRAVEECLRVLLPMLAHALEMVGGTSHGSDAAVVARS
ncbi:MAG: MogA/MoaB family molybdenum cofactor biosynthesis protein [Candidatus Omnitrophica bacterium]|nr:MogA/MoaB family molybdenum cofactor biosynthesis protein [Candidatus Omnitrophota bacterium]